MFGELPNIVALTVKFRLFVAVTCDEENLVVKLWREVVLIELVAAIQYGRNSVVLLGKLHEFCYAVPLLLCSPLRHLVFFYIHNGYQVLRVLVCYTCKVAELCAHAGFCG